jgi:hypothetical protein
MGREVFCVVAIRDPKSIFPKFLLKKRRKKGTVLSNKLLRRESKPGSDKCGLME